MRNRKVLLVEDESESRADLSAVIQSQGYEVVTADSGETAWNFFKRSNYLVVITDLLLPKMGGLRVLERIKSLHPVTKVIIITGQGKNYAIKALRLNAFDYIEKGNSKTIPDLLDAIERAFAEAEIQIRTERELLSFLTHTLRNTLSGGPQTVDQVLRLVRDLWPSHHEDPRVYKIRTNIASLYSIFTSIENMLDAYKFYVSDPADVVRKWDEDRVGDVTFEVLLARVLKQTIGRILFDESNVGQLKRLTAEEGASVKKLRETFMRALLGSDETRDQTVVDWLTEYLPAIKVNVGKSDVKFSSDGIRFSLLFAIISEIVYNALKYSDASQPIEITWEKRRTASVFACKNGFDNTSTSRSGSRKGLAFVSGLTRIIEGVDFAHRVQRNDFIVELRFKGDSLRGQL